MYDQLLDITLLEKYYYQVRLNTKHRGKILNFEMYYMINLLQILNVLQSRQYRHSPYNVFLIKEPKYRIIMSEIISDKIVNHLISNEILLPILEPKLIETNVATRKDKGVSKGIYYVKKYINRLKMNHDKIYVLKCDIKKYFYNIDHEILLEKLKKYIPDEEVLDVIANIIDTTNDESCRERIKKNITNEKKYLIRKNVHQLDKKFKELDMIPFYEKGKGIPIGNMSSQIFAIFYLNDLDHFIKEKLKVKYYIRYMDDFILLHWDKEFLKKCLVEIEKEVHKVKLELNKKTRIYSLHEGFNFLGYRFLLRGKRLLMLMNGQTKKRIIKKLNRLRKRKSSHYEAVKASYKGYLMNCQSKGFMHRHKWYDEKD